MLKELPTIQSAERRLFTVEEYARLDLTDRTELLAGVVYKMSPVNPPHSHAVSRLNRALFRGLADRYEVRSQDAIAVAGWRGPDAPEIDVAVIEAKEYPRTPTAADAFAFIEVSHTTYRDDRNYKIPLYVNAGVQSWIVNIPRRQVEHYGSVDALALPNGNVFAEGESFEVLGVLICVADLFIAEMSE